MALVLFSINAVLHYYYPSIWLSLPDFYERLLVIIYPSFIFLFYTNHPQPVSNITLVSDGIIVLISILIRARFSLAES